MRSGQKLLTPRIPRCPTTPQILLNYAAFLEEHKHFELSFQAYEKGVGLFKYPHSMPLWLSYLTKFAARFGGAKLERGRDLFEQALEGCPVDIVHQIYLLYAKYEEEYGLVSDARAQHASIIAFSPCPPPRPASMSAPPVRP